MLAGTACGVLPPAFTIAVMAGVARPVLAPILLSRLALGLLRGVAPWLPTHLVNALDGLAHGQSARAYLRAAAVRLVDRREP